MIRNFYHMILPISANYPTDNANLEHASADVDAALNKLGNAHPT